MKDLTPHQIRLARLRAAGYTQEEMAEKLNISVNTVKYHFKTINKILGVRPHYVVDFFKKFQIYQETHE